jgi:hypothetical protein
MPQRKREKGRVTRHSLAIRVSRDEHNKLKRLAKKLGITVTQLVFSGVEKLEQDGAK